MIKKYLSKNKLKEYEKLLSAKKEPEQADFLFTHMSWVGPTSPYSKEEILTKSVEEVIKDLISWRPKKERFSPSHEGYGRILSAAIEEKAEDYSKNSIKFINIQLRPVYIYHFFGGLRDGLNKGAKLDWDSVIKLANNIIIKAKNYDLLTFEKINDDLEAEWDEVFKSIVDLLRDGLNNQKLGPAFKNRKAIYEIIEYLCKHPDPTPEHEQTYGGDNQDPFTMSINTVRGQSFHALFAYISWCNRHLKKKDINENEIVIEAKQILKDHLDTGKEPSLTIRSVYGRYLPWIYSLDKKWTKNILGKLFPADDIERRCAAWETYLSNNVFEEAFKELRGEYRRAIQELSISKPKRKHWINPIEKLAEHIIIGYFYNLDDQKEPLCKKFFKEANAEQRGIAISFAGRAYITRDKRISREGFPDKKMLQDFWEWRLKESHDVDELNEFGWWAEKDVLDNKWMLEKLNETLEKTGGIIEAYFNVLKTLKSLVGDYPLLTISALYLIIKAKAINRLFSLHNKEIEIILREVYRTKNKEANNIADKTRDYLIKLGFEYYRHIK